MSDFELLPAPGIEGTGHDLPLDETSFANRPSWTAYLIVANMLAAMFMPWIVVRIPGREIDNISLFRLVGGEPMVFAFIFFVTVGLMLWAAKVKIGIALTSIAMGYIGWFAVLVSLFLGAIRGLLPPIGVGSIDISRGVIGVAPGAIISISALLIMGLEVLPQTRNIATKRTQLNGFGVGVFTLVLTLALTHTAVWVSASSDKYGAAVRLSGDSLFGSFAISALVWSAATVAIVVSLRPTERGFRLLSILLIAASLLKFIHALAFVLGNGILEMLLPNSVGKIVDVHSHWALWATVSLSLVGVGIGFFSAIGDLPRAKMEKIFSASFFPSLLLSSISIVAVAASYQVNR